jgi:hypothetical protein
MALLSPQIVPNTGVALTYGAVASTDTITPNLGYKYALYVKNANAGSDTVTILRSGTGNDVFGQAKPNVVVTITTGTEKVIYLSNQDQLADTSTGLISVTHSVTSSVTCALLAIPVNS